MTHPIARFALAAVLALACQTAAHSAQASAPAFVLDPLGTSVQEMRFCRPGERPTRPGQCLIRGLQRPLR
ncbi:hypothetical protein [Pararhodobacter zhoushanensis]|uniref:Uncharacterized protein n=1 Tax=Pararhodobacter zhoushanensis TaxID=2479545 RepID=A0ABT3GZ33_9RHOB|nr:hypothetical protein [Pararhodobacter zhoushanensis]MCW1932813.1 hypothetical protein [Pararhodobacter zhoushanensis]